MCRSETLRHTQLPHNTKEEMPDNIEHIVHSGTMSGQSCLSKVSEAYSLM
jgi:hypothetical protein